MVLGVGPSLSQPLPRQWVTSRDTKDRHGKGRKKGETDCGFEGRQGLQGEWGAQKDALKSRCKKGEGNAEEVGGLALESGSFSFS